MRDELDSSATKFIGQRGQGITGTHSTVSRQVHRLDAAALLDLDVFDPSFRTHFEADHGLNGCPQLPEGRPQPIAPYLLLNLAYIPGIDRSLASSRPQLQTDPTAEPPA